ncbi:MAG: hypothetical protein JOZ58_02170, partial [Acetobacteraceae bacterium]|nr:hypothetical protein [Acetobacteraceae bacterium]
MSYSFQTMNVPGDTFTELLGINNAGFIVGFHGQATNLAFFIPPGGTFTPVTAPNATQTDAVGINNNNQVVGFFTDNVSPATGVAGTTHG